MLTHRIDAQPSVSSCLILLRDEKIYTLPTDFISTHRHFTIYYIAHEIFLVVSFRVSAKSFILFSFILSKHKIFYAFMLPFFYHWDSVN